MSIKEWTPIQEGRFHLLSMRPRESIGHYIMRMYPPPVYTPSARGERRDRVVPLIKMARAERDKARR